MKIVADGDTAVDVDPGRLDRGGHYEFPCGCKFAKAGGAGPLPAGHLPIRLDLEGVPLDCPATWGLISSGRTRGIFQLESPLGRHWAKKLRPERIEHLSALAALLRPGCLRVRDEEGVNVPEHYCRRKNGEEDVAMPIPAIADILADTYGLMVYQEQIMAIAQRVAGFTLREADELRKAIGKKDQGLLAKVGRNFVEKAEAHGVIARGVAESLFDDIRKSGRYLFNRSHSVSYAINGYWSAYWKAHFPIYFFTSYLFWAKEKAKPLKEIWGLVNEARHFGIGVGPPRLAAMRAHFGCPDGVRVEFGLADVKEISDKTFAKMRGAARDVCGEIGPVTGWSWYEFLTLFSGSCGAVAVRRMIEVGALEGAGGTRQRMLAEFDAWSRLSDGEKKAVLALGPAAPRNLEGSIRHILNEPVGFTKGTRKTPSRPKYAVTAKRRPLVESVLKLLENPPSKLVDTPAWVAKKEEENLGIPLTTSHVEAADRSAVNTTVQEYLAGKQPRSWGELFVLGVEVQDANERVVQNGDSRGRRMGRLAVADETGVLEEVVCFPDCWEQYGHMLRREHSVVALGGKRSRKDGVSFYVEKVWEI